VSGSITSSLGCTSSVSVQHAGVLATRACPCGPKGLDEFTEANESIDRLL